MAFAYHIRQDSSGDYGTISEALNDLTHLDPENQQHRESPVTLIVHGGIYRERITITRPFLTMVGTSAAGTVITYDLYARMPI